MSAVPLEDLANQLISDMHQAWFNPAPWGGDDAKSVASEAVSRVGGRLATAAVRQAQPSGGTLDADNGASEWNWAVAQIVEIAISERPEETLRAFYDEALDSVQAPIVLEGMLHAYSRIDLPAVLREMEGFLLRMASAAIDSPEAAGHAAWLLRRHLGDDPERIERLLAIYPIDSPCRQALLDKVKSYK